MDDFRTLLNEIKKQNQLKGNLIYTKEFGLVYINEIDCFVISIKDIDKDLKTIKLIEND